MRFLISFAFTAGFALSSGCAHLHHVEIGEIDQSKGPVEEIEVKVSETGLDVEQAASIAKVISRNKAVHRTADTVSDVWKVITYGPKTGEVTFSDDYAEGLDHKLAQACPNGRITGVTSMRETNKYPVISGEIVRVTALCGGGSKQDNEEL